jgi:hypothetical protein
MPAMEIQLGDVGHIIQLAIAPAFLLTGLGTNLTVLTNRLSRIIDRTRVLEDRLPGATQEERTHFEAELETLYGRTHLINRAITLSTSSALLVCVVIASMFVGDALDLELGKFIGALFVLAMLALIVSFIFFLREIFVATSAHSTLRLLVSRK